jgi:hypothetical protein
VYNESVPRTEVCSEPKNAWNIIEPGAEMRSV